MVSHVPEEIPNTVVIEVDSLLRLLVLVPTVDANARDVRRVQQVSDAGRPEAPGPPGNEEALPGEPWV